MTRNIVLTGFMGSGKTTVGKLLSKELQMGFVDTDAIIEKTLGLSVKEIFEKYGEECFRKEEFKVMNELLARNSLVIATGAGAFENKEIRDRCKRDCITVYLQASLNYIIKNVWRFRESRPKLANKSEEEIRSLYTKRESYYKESDFKIAVDDLTPKQIVSQIIIFLRTYGKQGNIRKRNT